MTPPAPWGWRTSNSPPWKMAAWVLPLGSALRRVMLPSRVSRIEPTGSAATSESGTYSAAPGTLTVTVPVRTATLTVSPRTGGGTLAAEVGVGAAAAAGGGGAPAAGAARRGRDGRGEGNVVAAPRSRGG